MHLYLRKVWNTYHMVGTIIDLSIDVRKRNNYNGSLFNSYLSYGTWGRRSE